ncbi:hypothetical protein DICPUDRAFT_36795 [Dictyostelium purpureum]|uniref:Transmembrane protein n=1 Tax=Dictyostelium purpureum TaxID=5786 RepID=F0ZRP2_DICPU|nr:uncharacterized protein DICPUDRAFT_36795 [Dictyostelium purpureum]EGC33384.1 hypothetical protein DICPUDRAFT_36795 [Dictyostelium purpureum]|eukprot:XP_003290092.1 hypothetical protein DICPUDRAFT_36795 [Dictyostelium purpureum]
MQQQSQQPSSQQPQQQQSYQQQQQQQPNQQSQPLQSQIQNQLPYQSIYQNPQQHQSSLQQSLPIQYNQQQQQQSPLQQPQFQQQQSPLPQQQQQQITQQSPQQPNQFNYNTYQSPIQQSLSQQSPQHQQISPQTQQSTYQNQQSQSNHAVNNPNNINTNIMKNKYFTKEETDLFIQNSFNKKISEWKNWTLTSTLIVYIIIVAIQMFFLTYFITSNLFSIWTLFYLIGQIVLCFSYNSIITVYRQVPASFRESISKLSTKHYIFILLNLILQISFLSHLFGLPKNNFTFSLMKDHCFEDATEGYILKCQSEYNLFFPLFLISAISLVGSIIFKTFSNQEFVLSFPKANISTILQIKSMVYNNFWINFYSSFYLFGIGSFLLGFIFLFLYRTFTIQIIVYSGQLWVFSFVILFQNFLRYRLFEIYYTRSLRFSVDKFVLDEQPLDENKPTIPFPNSNLSSNTTNTNNNNIRSLKTPTIENPNIFLEKAIHDDDPLVQFLGWKDLLYISKYSQSRRNQLYSEIIQMVDKPTLLEIISTYEKQIYDLDSIFSSPREYYEPNYKKDDGDKPKDNKTSDKKNTFKFNFSFSGTIKKIITQLTGIKFEYNAYDSEIKQALSNTQSVLWSIEAIGALIVSAQINDDPKVMEYLHRYQVPQKFLAPLLRIISIVEKLENDLQFQVEMDRSTLIQEYYFIKTLINQVEPPKNCFGILQTSRPHFRIFKQIGKNTISQVLETIGNQISDISFPIHLRPLLNSYKTGEFSIYQ